MTSIKITGLSLVRPRSSEEGQGRENISREAEYYFLLFLEE
jgi:hypothetical protein